MVCGCGVLRVHHVDTNDAAHVKSVLKLVTRARRMPLVSH
jgi:hypothetical protein